MARSSCSAEALPEFRLSLKKERCLRKTANIIKGPADVAAFVSKHYGCEPQEHFIALYLNAGSEVVAVHHAHVGAISTSMVDPKVLFSAALVAGAPAMILVHNHPSGNNEPSQADLGLTQQLVTIGKLLGIQIHDHIVIARGGGYTSFVERGIMPK